MVHELKIIKKVDNKLLTKTLIHYQMTFIC